MCSYSWQLRMDDDQLGDLGDVVRASACGAAPSGAGRRLIDAAAAGWEQLLPEPAASFPGMIGESNVDDGFGDPFSGFEDYPLLHDLAGTKLFDGAAAAAAVGMNISAGDPNVGGAIADADGGGSSSQVMAGRKIDVGTTVVETKGRTCGSVFPEVPTSVQVSPEGIRAAAGFGDEISSLAAGRPLDEGGFQIPSTRMPSIKRRKGQPKKVVCIPAPAAASNRPGGEVVPPDLWAWRKYGQKPIKGSPYPRGYYRCSSSKGCSARKQVERSRTDPNMLVITYTSEHNHPWPTQRNALAGSTRTTQPSKNASPAASRCSSHGRRSPPIKEESKEMPTAADAEEEAAPPEPKIPPAEGAAGAGAHEIVPDFHGTYVPLLPEPAADPSVDDLFAGLGELESDPMRLVFSKHFVEGKAEGGRGDGDSDDPFSIFDGWGGNSPGEAGK